VTGVTRRTFPLSRRFLLFLALLQGFLIYIWIIEPNWIEVTRYEVTFKNLPVEFDGLVVAHLSDLHIRAYGFRERRIEALLAEEKPGLIVLTGDLSQEGSEPATIRHVLKDITNVKPAFGAWAVLGDEDHWSPPVAGQEALRGFFNETGFALLTNEGGRLGKALDTLSLIGVDDPSTGHADLTKSLRGFQRTPFAILLTHSPQIFFRADLARFDLVLAGHTRGGQARLPLIGALWLPAGSEGYESGWFYGEHARMFVSRGVGTSLLPFRFLCRPEIALITLKRA
jgi:predicted MPP superfamily phosphohydrolase